MLTRRCSNLGNAAVFQVTPSTSALVVLGFLIQVCSRPFLLNCNACKLAVFPQLFSSINIVPISRVLLHMVRVKCPVCQKWGRDRCTCGPTLKSNKSPQPQSTQKKVIIPQNTTRTTSSKTAYRDGCAPKPKQRSSLSTKPVTSQKNVLVSHEPARVISASTATSATTPEPKGLVKKPSLELELELERVRIKRLRLESEKSARKRARKAEKEHAAERVAKATYWSGGRWSYKRHDKSWSGTAWSQRWLSKGDRQSWTRVHSGEATLPTSNFPPPGLVWDEAELSACNDGCN